MRYKGIVHNVFNDAPFIGALIIANDCSMPCKDCLNEPLKDKKYTVKDTAEEIIRKVLDNKLNEGIILSGLEWSEQPDDLVDLVNEALRMSLEVMVYTHHDDVRFFELIPDLIGKPIYIKFGLYDEALKVVDNVSFGVQLATSNQYIAYFG